MIPCHCIRHLMFLSICQRDVWSPTWLTLTSSLKVLLATQRADEYFHLMSNEYFPNEVCDVALEIENSSVCLRGREDGFMSSSLLPGMIWLSPTTQDGNNIKVKWWNAEIKGARQVHQICYDAPKFLLASVFCNPLVSCLAVEDRKFEGRRHETSWRWTWKNWEGKMKKIITKEWRVEETCR